MLTPEQMDTAGEEVAAVYRQIEAELIEYLTSRLIAGDISGQRTRIALNILSQADPVQIRKILDAHAGEIDAAVRADVERSLGASDAFDLAAMAKGIDVIAPAGALTAQTLAVMASVRSALARDNLELAAAARTKFLQWSTWATTQTVTGNMTADVAIRKAVRELARGGLSITSVTYRNPETGKVTVTNKADVAVQRHVRSLIGQGAAQLTFERMRQNGVGFVEVSSHIGSRPSHAEWQGRVYHVGGSIDYEGEHYEDFAYGTGYQGECGPYTALGDQLLGVNCRHSFAPWVPGSPRAYSPDPDSPTGLTNDEIYDLAQGQRARERKIREAKRELKAAQQLYDTDPSPENAKVLTKAKTLLKNRQAAMREYIKDANAKCKSGTQVLKRMPNREWAGDMPKGAKATRTATMQAMKHEEPLVKMKADRNALSASPVVNTKEYHDAFEEMPVPKPVAEGAYREAGRILSATDGTEFEHLAAIDARTGELVADNFDAAPTRARATGFRASDIEKIKAHRDGVVTIHNHPGSKQPSFRDVVTAAENSEVRGSIVVGHDGSVWYVSVSDPSVADRLIAGYNDLKGTYGDLAEAYALREFLSKDAGERVDWRRLR